MDILYAILGLLALTIIGFGVSLTLIKKKHTDQIKAQLEKVGTLETANINGADFKLVTTDKTYLIKLFFAPGAYEVSFNSKRHWQIFTPSGKKMFETNGFADIAGDKLVVIYPNPGKIVKYINENEVVFVKPTMDVFGMTVIHVDQITEFFNVEG
jgi:hypothetical protein